MPACKFEQFLASFYKKITISSAESASMLSIRVTYYRIGEEFIKQEFSLPGQEYFFGRSSVSLPLCDCDKSRLLFSGFIFWHFIFVFQNGRAAKGKINHRTLAKLASQFPNSSIPLKLFDVL